MKYVGFQECYFYLLKDINHNTAITSLKRNYWLLLVVTRRYLRSYSSLNDLDLYLVWLLGLEKKLFFIGHSFINKNQYDLPDWSWLIFIFIDYWPGVDKDVGFLIDKIKHFCQHSLVTMLI